MDLNNLSEITGTPKPINNVVGKLIKNSTVIYDSPLSGFSTPRRFTKIRNPFESHIIERLHLPTFSPSVFAQVSTPKTEEIFRWSIDHVANINPAEIDETTLDNHITDHDPNVESLVQSKIDQFFKEDVIVPSPLTAPINNQVPPLLPKDSYSTGSTHTYTESSAQTVLTLPPVLPPELEEMLKPYFTYTEDQHIQIKNETSFARKLFEFEHRTSPQTQRESASPVYEHLSLIHTSPIGLPGQCDGGSSRTSPTQDTRSLSELRECNLSPIQTGNQFPEMSFSPKHSRSVCRLSFSHANDSHMSIDASVRVPDILYQNDQSVFECGQSLNSLPSSPIKNDSNVQWDVEYTQVSLITPDDSGNGNRMETSNSNTPHSRIFTSQRKRLSDSFKCEDVEDSALNNTQDHVNYTTTNTRRLKSRLFREEITDNTDAGYHTESRTMFEDSSTAWNLNNSSHLFASTPTKKINQ